MPRPTPDPFPEGPDTQPLLPPRNLLQIAWQRKALVLLGLVVGLVAGALLFLQRTPVYQSSTQVLVIKKRSDAVPIAGGDPRLAFYDDYVATHLVLIRSPLILERAVKKRELQTLRSLQGDPVGIMMGSLTAGRESSKEAGALPNNIIQLTYRCSEAEDCTVILNAVIASYRDFLDETYRNVSDNTLELITRARDLLEKDLAEKEKKYRAFRETSPLLWKGKDGVNVHLARIAELEAKRSTLLMRAAEIEERLRAVENAPRDKDRTLLLTLASPTAEKQPPANLDKALEEQLFPLLLQEQALLEDHGKDHPAVLAVRKKIEMTREFFGRLRESLKKGEEGNGKGEDAVQAHLRLLKQDLAVTQVAQQSLARLVESEQKEARALASYEIQDEAFRTDIARTQQIYEQTIKRLQEINLVRDFGGYDARVIAPAGLGNKVAPSAWQFLFAGAALGLLVGGGLAYLAEVTDKSFRTPEEIKRRLGLAVVGHIPNLQSRQLSEPTAVNGSVRRFDPTLCAFHHASSLAAESYRGVRTSLFFRAHDKGAKLVQITSPNTGDGKTTLAANLAVAIAQAGKTVLLVDADCRRPRAHTLFGLQAEVGLATLLAADGEPADAVQDSGVPGLSLLPCGPPPRNPSELLTLPRFGELLRWCRDRYDFVLLDTPPLLAVTDPCVVAAQVDGVVLVLRVCKNGRPAAERAREVLLTLGVPVLGVVVNGVGEQGGGPFGCEHYHHGDGYNYESAAGTENGQGAAASPKPTRFNGWAWGKWLRGPW